MPLNEFQRAFLINGLIEKAQVIDPATGAPLDWSTLGGTPDATAVTFTPVGNIAATNVAAALAELDTEKQPVDSDLTAIAALSTTSFGRALLALADAAALRTAAALGTAATQNTGAFDASGAAAAAQAASQPLDSDLTAIAALTTTSYGRAFLALADAAAARTALALGSLATASAVTTSQLPATYQTGTIQIAVDNGSTVLSTGIAARFVVPFTCTVTSWEILANTSGSIQFDIWKVVYASYPPTISNTITASAKPLISSATKATSSTLTGWTTLLTAGDVVFINIDSATTIASAVLALSVTRS
jgi:hypothetical protein